MKRAFGQAGSSLVNTADLSMEEREELAAKATKLIGNQKTVAEDAMKILDSASDVYFKYLEENMINNQARQIELTGQPSNALDKGIIGASDTTIQALNETIGVRGTGEGGEGGTGILGSL